MSSSPAAVSFALQHRSEHAVEGAPAPTAPRLAFAAGVLTVETSLLGWDEGPAREAGAGRWKSSLGVLEEERRVWLRQRAPLSEDRWTALERGTLSLQEALTALHEREPCRELVLHKRGVLGGVGYLGIRVVPLDPGAPVPPLRSLFDDGDRGWQWTAQRDAAPGGVRLLGSFTDFYTTLAHRTARRALGR